MESISLASFGDLLKEYRKHKKITQRQLAAALGVHYNTIWAWERGDYLPETRGIVLELARLLKLDDQQTRQLLEASLTALAPHWWVPLPRNPYFTGREEALRALHEQLGVDQAVALTQSSALHGLGGIGKTQIALEYAYRYALDYRAVFWIGAETEEQIIASFLRMAEVLQLPGREDKEQQRVVTAVQRWLSVHDQWLLIWDNVEDLELLHRFLPTAQQGAILLTTRCQTLGTLAQGRDLLPMEPEEATLFLLRRAKVLEAGATREQMQQLATRAPETYAAAKAVVTALGGLPLALDQAGAYIEETRCGLPAYLELFRARWAALLARRGQGSHQHPESVSTTFGLAITATAQRHPAVQDLLRVCALLQPDAIPEELFRQGAAHLGASLEAVCHDPLEWDRAVGVACSYSLLSRQPEERTLSIHRLVQAVLLDTMADEEQERWSERVIAALDALFPIRVVTEYAAWKQCERLLPHALLCLQRVGAGERSCVLASLASKVGQYLDVRGRHTEAERILQQALGIWEQTDNPDQLAMVVLLTNLASVYLKQGKNAQAEVLFQRALRIGEQALGPVHKEVARALNGLANLYWEQGKYAQAEALFQRAVQIKEQAHGPERLNVAPPLTNLASIYMEQGRYAEAELLARRALAVSEQMYGTEHPEFAFQLNALAELYAEQGQYAQAEPLHQRALHLRETTLGAEHYLVAFSLTNLGKLYTIQGKDAQAEPLFQRALSIWERALGPDHPECARALDGLAILYRERSQYAEAEAFFQRACTLREQSLGSDHPLLARSLNHLADMYREQSQYTQAEPLFQRALQIWEQALGPEHPNVATTLNGLANLHRDQSHYPEAEQLYQRARSIREQRLGQHHPDTAQTLHDLALLRQKQSKLNEALALAERALYIRSQALGEAHPKTVATRTLYEQLLQEQAAGAEQTAMEQEGKAVADTTLPSLHKRGDASSSTNQPSHLSE